MNTVPLIHFPQINSPRDQFGGVCLNLAQMIQSNQDLVHTDTSNNNIKFVPNHKRSCVTDRYKMSNTRNLKLTAEKQTSTLIDYQEGMANMLKTITQRDNNLEEILENTILNIKGFEDALEHKNDHEFMGKSLVNEQLQKISERLNISKKDIDCLLKSTNNISFRGYNQDDMVNEQSKVDGLKVEMKDHINNVQKQTAEKIIRVFGVKIHSFQQSQRYQELNSSININMTKSNKRTSKNSKFDPDVCKCAVYINEIVDMKTKIELLESTIKQKLTELIEKESQIKILKDAAEFINYKVDQMEIHSQSLQRSIDEQTKQRRLQLLLSDNSKHKQIKDVQIKNQEDKSFESSNNDAQELIKDKQQVIEQIISVLAVQDKEAISYCIQSMSQIFKMKQNSAQFYNLKVLSNEINSQNSSIIEKSFNQYNPKVTSSMDISTKIFFPDSALEKGTVNESQYRLPFLKPPQKIQLQSPTLSAIVQKLIIPDQIIQDQINSSKLELSLVEEQQDLSEYISSSKHGNLMNVQDQKQPQNTSNQISRRKKTSIVQQNKKQNTNNNEVIKQTKSKQTLLINTNKINQQSEVQSKVQSNSESLNSSQQSILRSRLMSPVNPDVISSSRNIEASPNFIQAENNQKQNIIQRKVGNSDYINETNKTNTKVNIYSDSNSKLGSQKSTLTEQKVLNNQNLKIKLDPQIVYYSTETQTDQKDSDLIKNNETEPIIEKIEDQAQNDISDVNEEQEMDIKLQEQTNIISVGTSLESQPLQLIESQTGIKSFLHKTQKKQKIHQQLPISVKIQERQPSKQKLRLISDENQTLFTNSIETNIKSNLDNFTQTDSILFENYLFTQLTSQGIDEKIVQNIVRSLKYNKILPQNKNIENQEQFVQQDSFKDLSQIQQKQGLSIQQEKQVFHKRNLSNQVIISTDVSVQQQDRTSFILNKKQSLTRYDDSNTRDVSKNTSPQSKNQIPTKEFQAQQLKQIKQIVENPSLDLSEQKEKQIVQDLMEQEEVENVEDYTQENILKKMYQNLVSVEKKSKNINNTEMIEKLRLLNPLMDQIKFESFCEFIKQFKQYHSPCGKDCGHLARFYLRFGLILSKFYKSKKQIFLAKPELKPFHQSMKN